MRKVRSLGAAMVLLVFIFSNTILTFGDTRTVKFSDIDTSWAKQNIVNVYSKGLMDGITETTFKPKDFVKNYDVIISIAKMMNGTDSSNLGDLEKKYKSDLDKFKVPAYARKEVAFCLEKGIIKDIDVSYFTDDVKSTTKKAYAAKKDVCYYLGRAFGVTYNSKNPPVALGFKDALYIPTTYKPHVAFLISKGVISDKGDAKQNFNPDESVNRETFAKMLDVSYTVYQKDYKNGQGSTTTTAPVDNSTDTTTGTNNTAATPATTDNSNSNNNNNDNNASTDTSTGISIENQNSDAYNAIVEQVIPEYGNIVVFVKDSNGAKTKKVYKIADNVICTIDGANSYYHKLKQGDLITIGLSGDKVISISAESATKKVLGVLSDITITDRIMLVMETDKKEIKKYPITEKTTIIKDGKKANYQDLNKGNNILVTIQNGEMVEANADGVKNSDKGVIESITYNRTAPPKVIITDDEGGRSEYYISKGITDNDITIDGASSSVYALRPGMLVNLELIDEEITKIVTLKTMTDMKITATIKNINLEVKYIIINIYDDIQKKNVDKIVFASNAKIADEELNNLNLNQLKIGDSIRILGTEDTEGIVAKSILVEK